MVLKKCIRTLKADVYIYGVLLVELIGNNYNDIEDDMGLHDWILEQLQEGKRSIVRKSLLQDNDELANSITEITVKCQVFIQVLSSYSTLPLYALVTQMGNHYKKSMFDDHVQACLLDWAEKVKRKRGHKAARDCSSHSTDGSLGSPISVNGYKESQTGV
ncbi:hypothetical protein K7X08_003476 [Anisodus acutangulus]|uniref:Serine-threonine/tyrosine-protein kinase catalytic domain-containing protein n=1 Tax=Anisodus acutangulus TaxID=402998 RepID=A0A9Q1MFR4_9SOLA|nr:hypothetical protein K7X08_003476 [Anisodus acutangulus]